MKNEWRMVMESITETLRKRLGLDFPSSFSFFSLISLKSCWFHMLAPSFSPLTPIYRKWGVEVAQQVTCLLPPEVTCSPKRAGYFIPKLSSGPRGWKMSQKWPFCPSFEYFAHFLPKHHKTLQIACQLVLCSLIQLARIQMLANDHSRTKLGYDTCMTYTKNSKNRPRMTRIHEQMFLEFNQQNQNSTQT